MIRLALLTPFIVSGLALAFLAFVNRRTLFRNSSDDPIDYDADLPPFVGLPNGSFIKTSHTEPTTDA